MLKETDVVSVHDVASSIRVTENLVIILKVLVTVTVEVLWLIRKSLRGYLE